MTNSSSSPADPNIERCLATPTVKPSILKTTTGTGSQKTHFLNCWSESFWETRFEGRLDSHFQLAAWILPSDQPTGSGSPIFPKTWFLKTTQSSDSDSPFLGGTLYIHNMCIHVVFEKKSVWRQSIAIKGEPTDRQPQPLQIPTDRHKQAARPSKRCPPQSPCSACSLFLRQPGLFFLGRGIFLCSTSHLKIVLWA